jgi:hypothetical protein
VKVEDSRSYPGLMCQYVLHLADVAVMGLPTENFTTMEYNKDGSLNKTLHWEWVSHQNESTRDTRGSLSQGGGWDDDFAPPAGPKRSRSEARAARRAAGGAGKR